MCRWVVGLVANAKFVQGIVEFVEPGLFRTILLRFIYAYNTGVDDAV